MQTYDIRRAPIAKRQDPDSTALARGGETFKPEAYVRASRPSSRRRFLAQALAAGRAHPVRLVPFCCIDPRTSYRGGRAGLRAMLKDYVDQGARGFGEHKAGLPIDDRRMMALYEACADLGLPVLFHCDDQ